MKKRIAIVTTVCVVVMLGAGAAAFAVSASKSVAPASASPRMQTGSGAVKAGSQWTLYNIQFDGSYYGFGPCEVLSFQSHGTFTGDKGDVGRWSKNLKLTFTNGAFFWPGTFSAKYSSDLASDGPGFQGDDETGAAWAGIGPLRLYQNPISGGPTC
jgi:hypothetical protein